MVRPERRERRTVLPGATPRSGPGRGSVEPAPVAADGARGDARVGVDNEETRAAVRGAVRPACGGGSSALAAHGARASDGGRGDRSIEHDVSCVVGGRSTARNRGRSDRCVHGSPGGLSRERSRALTCGRRCGDEPSMNARSDSVKRARLVFDARRRVPAPRCARATVAGLRVLQPTKVRRCTGSGPLVRRSMGLPETRTAAHGARRGGPESLGRPLGLPALRVRGHDRRPGTFAGPAMLPPSRAGVAGR